MWQTSRRGLREEDMEYRTRTASEHNRSILSYLSRRNALEMSVPEEPFLYGCGDEPNFFVTQSLKAIRR